MNIYQSVKERFLRYVKIDTTSKPNCSDTPTTKCQFDLAKLLYEELLAIGASDVYFDTKNCIVYGCVKANVENAISWGLIAHMDTSPDVCGKDVKPWVYENYDGKDVILNEKENIVMQTAIFDNLLKYIGDDIVFTDGTTLLGGDDKAAIAEVMTLAEYLITNKNIPHGDIKIAFTPDEEVGGLAKDLDFNILKADIAYTVDGDHVGYYSDETFNATEAQIHIKGKNVHPGTAYNIMINAVSIASSIIEMLPNERPETTREREGYYHPHYIDGNVEQANLYVLIRDHDDDNFENRKKFIEGLVKKVNEKYNNEIATLKFANGYYSMKKVVDKVPFMVEDLVASIIEANEKPYHLAFRGGTDGSSISQRGLPCPNISAGYENGHSRYEFVPIQSMEKITNILIKLAIKLSERKK